MFGYKKKYNWKKSESECSSKKIKDSKYEI